MAAAYRSGYEGAGAGDRQTAGRASDGDVVDDAVEGDPRAPRGRDEMVETRERSRWRHGIEGGDRLVRERPGRGLGDGRERGGRARWADSDASDADIERRQDRGREDVEVERERGGGHGQERGVSGESGERGGRVAGSEGHERGEREDVEESRDRRDRRVWRERDDGGRQERQNQDGGGERDEEDRETFRRGRRAHGQGGNVPTDDYRRMHEARSKERLDHDLARDTGRGPFKRMKETLKGMAKARPSDRKPEPPRYKESDDWNHFWGSGG